VKRPRYLVVALIAALVFGAGCWTEGCGRLEFYRSGEDQSVVINAGIKGDADRARAEALYHRFTAVSDDARKRVIPLAAATFVLGAALLALASRGLAGKTRSRGALMQVVAAQALVVMLAYFVTRDVHNAELDWAMERAIIQQHEALPQQEFDEVLPKMQAMRPYLLPSWLVFRSVASALILLALSRPRSREFFEAAGKPLSEG
jgi:hypothetical protein